MINEIPEEEIKKMDNALLDLVNLGILKVVTMEDGEKGFVLSKELDLT